MKLRVFLRDGSVLDFLEREEGWKEVNQFFKLAVKNKDLIWLPCTNGDFLINPQEVLYMICTPDQPLEPDQRAF
jgi:hypothetical protein